MEDSSNKEYDIIIFGATGYTGQYVIEELVNSTNNLNIKWAVAGRNKEKLKASLELVQNYLGEDINIKDIPIIEADVQNEESISNMTKKAKLILNCVGPYKLYGEIVVSKCIENGTHHVDISGEMKYLETTQVDYFDAAKEKGIYIVQACGFDSIPADVGIALMKKKFPGDLNSVESYVKIGQGSSGRSTNIGTFLSAIHSVRDVIEERKYDELLKEKLFKKDVVKSNYPLLRRFPLFYSEIVKGWCLWFLGPDERVIKRSQLFQNEFLNERPVQAYAYMKMHSLLIAFSYIFFAGIFGFLSLFSFGRYLLSNYPSFFTAGAFSKKGPTRKQVKEGYTEVVLSGEGWSEKLAEPSDQHTEKPNKKLTLKITGPEPAYALTSICMVNAGLTILEESNKMPLNGGVLTPGVAFENTTLVDRLQKRGVKFSFEG